METCITLGSLYKTQADHLMNAGSDYYNYNLDTSPEFYSSVITTSTYQERLDTLDEVRRQAGIKVCGIIGMGASHKYRINLLEQLANVSPTPESIPINILDKVKGTPFKHKQDLDVFDFIRTIVVARIMMPATYIRLSIGRENARINTSPMFYGRCQFDFLWQ